MRAPDGMEYMLEDLQKFLNEWTVDPNNVKPLLMSLLEHTERLPEIRVRYKNRPGISHSVRLVNSSLPGGGFFALIDVVNDDPENRWLSVCFYADMVNDYAKKGDYIPGALGGADSICYSVEDPAGFEDYLKEKINEAFVRSASADPENARLWKLC